MTQGINLKVTGPSWTGDVAGLVSVEPEVVTRNELIYERKDNMSRGGGGGQHVLTSEVTRHREPLATVGDRATL